MTNRQAARLLYGLLWAVVVSEAVRLDWPAPKLIYLTEFFEALGLCTLCGMLCRWIGSDWPEVE